MVVGGKRLISVNLSRAGGVKVRTTAVCGCYVSPRRGIDKVVWNSPYVVGHTSLSSP